MANELDEMDVQAVNPNGRDVNVIEKKIQVKTGVGSIIFEILLWVLGIIPGIIFLIMKVNAQKYLASLQQKIQHDASQIDNYLEQRVVILENVAGLLNKSIDLDKTTFVAIAEARGGNRASDDLNDRAQQIENINAKINVAMEAYPELRSQAQIANAMQQNSYLQKEITAAREVYNDTVLEWNTAIFAWPTKMIVASKKGYTTRIPFSVSKETKDRARANFFN
ncbi:MAG: LemA family protein [Bacilli bacterium]|nr:LemA family protein [Bacilli bacterium]